MKFISFKKRRQKADAEITGDSLLGIVDTLAAGAFLLVEAGVTDWRGIIAIANTLIAQQAAQDGAGQHPARHNAAGAIKLFAEAQLLAEAKGQSRPPFVM